MHRWQVAFRKSCLCENLLNVVIYCSLIKSPPEVSERGSVFLKASGTGLSDQRLRLAQGRFGLTPLYTQVKAAYFVFGFVVWSGLSCNA